MRWFFMMKLCEILLVSILAQKSLGFDLYEAEKEPSILPVSRLGRSGYLAIVEEKKQSGGMMPYPRLGRQIFELPQTVIPYPRAGRMLEGEDYDIIFTPEIATISFDHPWVETIPESNSLLQKRAFKLIPRIGRKKRSVSEEDFEPSGDKNDGNDKKRNSGTKTPTWDDFDELTLSEYFRPNRLVARARSSFVPRVGKKSFDDEVEDETEKRAVAFTPRIGRAPLIPRIGRNDARFQVKSRGAFIPRIGRRAALIPRIGRSEHPENKRQKAN